LLFVESPAQLFEVIACGSEKLLARLANLCHDGIFPAFCVG
jgi:hypothetical protein